MDEKKKLINTKQRDKANWRSKRQDEEKIINNLEIQRKEKQGTFNEIIQPFKDQLQKQLNQVNKISPGDLTEIKNTWDGLTFGKFILGKLYELNGDNNTEWDYVKKSLDIKIIKNFANLDPVKKPEILLPVTREVTNNPDFSPGDKYQKPFRTCGILCDYFLALKKYFDEVERQKELLDEISKLSNEIAEHNAKSREYINNVTNEFVKTFDKNIKNEILGKNDRNHIVQSIDQFIKCIKRIITENINENENEHFNQYVHETENKQPNMTFNNI